ncbi:GNAT family N-acetyltransferase [Methylobacterium sp. J-068]|uniref:GNAT family N-acetyltransferase n=1 Tax=Methylobacterium sp. J-068 TaxID=2836649 RepID=UPI001FB8DC76|nr:GNAT family N-acetyltransferase [Methylobacterium sp. J-068]MCJ2035002.1 GNAT family N-acetyltransferase [Methylobacterium sp. J-068]
MAVLAQGRIGAGAMREQAKGDLSAEVFGDLAAVEALWRGMEADPAVLATPYQRFDWVAAYAGVEPEADLRIVVLRDAAGRPRVLIPLVVAREGGMRVARVVGAKHANYHMPLFASREAAAMRPEDLAEQLRNLGRRTGIDVYALSHQPRFWDGAANPMSVRAEPSPSDAYGLILGPDPESTVKRVFSGDARKKLRSKEKKLVEAFGPVECRRAATPEEVASYLDAFYGQKASRFAAMGIANPYADAAVRDFLAQGASVEGGIPAIEVSALVATRTGRVFAVFAGAVDALRYSGMVTSFDADPVVSRSSPGDILLHHLIGEQTARGRRAFDLGVGEARYKSSICDETIALGEVAIPVTLRGHLFALKTIGIARLKRRIKRDPRLMRWVARLRRRPVAPAE